MTDINKNSQFCCSYKLLIKLQNSIMYCLYILSSFYLVLYVQYKYENHSFAMYYGCMAF